MSTPYKKCAGIVIVILSVLPGLAQVHPDIVGGSEYYYSQVPYQALLDVSNVDACGAVIISPNWVVTAGHCVVWGIHCLSVVQMSEAIVTVTQIIIWAKEIDIFRS
jgi:secreted trypsin-like serine protease